MNLKKIKINAITGAKWAGISSISISVTAVLKIIVLTRFLDKSDFGLIALANLVLALSTIFMDIGLSISVLHKLEITDLQFASLYWVNMIISFFLFILLVCISPLMAWFYKEPALIALISTMGLGLIFTSFGRLFRVLEEKDLNFKLLGIIDISAAFVSLCVAVITAILGMGVYSLIWSNLLFLLLSSSLYFIFGTRRKINIFRFSLAKTKGFYKVGTFYTAEQLVNYFSREIDIILIGKFFSAETLGVYSLAKQLANRPASLVNPIFVRVAAPIFSKLQKEKNYMKLGYCKLLNIISSINLPIYILLFIFAKQVICILYGNTYSDASTLFRIFTIYMLFVALRNPVGSLTIGSGNTHIGFYWTLVTLSVTTLAIYLTLPYGIEAVTIAMTVSLIILYFSMFGFIIKRITDMKIQEFLTAHIPDYKWLFINIRNHLFQTK